MDDFSKLYPNVPMKAAKHKQPGSREIPMLLFQSVKVIFRQGQNTTLVSWVYARNELLGIDLCRRLDHEPPWEPSHSAPTNYTPKTTTMIDWRYEICHFLHLDPKTPGADVFHELQVASAKMKEAERMAQETATHQVTPRHQAIHRVHCAADEEQVIYLEEPWVVHAGPSRSHLRGSQQVTNMELYLERNKDVSFLVLREYSCCRERAHAATRPRSGKESATMLVSEHINIVSKGLQSRLASLADVVFQGIPHPKFGRDDGDGTESVSSYESVDSEFSTRDSTDIHYPYLWFYHRRPKISKALENLQGTDQESLIVFCDYIQNRMSDEWAAVDQLTSEGKITAEYLRYVFVSFLAKENRYGLLLSQIPGEIVLWAPEASASTKLQAYLVTGWLRRWFPAPDRFSAKIMAASWSFDGKFQRYEIFLTIGDLPSLSHAFKISDLNPYPKAFSDNGIGITKALRERGNMFWRCRFRNYVCYKSFVDDGIKTAVSSRMKVGECTI